MAVICLDLTPACIVKVLCCVGQQQDGQNCQARYFKKGSSVILRCVFFFCQSHFLPSNGLLLGRRPSWKTSLLEESLSNLPPLTEPPRRLGKLKHVKFIMDRLKEEGKKQYDSHMAKFENFLSSARQQYKAQQGITRAKLYVDPALEAPWKIAMERAKRLFELDGNARMIGELDGIRDHVQIVRESHSKLLGQYRSGKERNGRSHNSPRKDISSFTNKPIQQRQNILRELSLLFNQMPQGNDFIVLSPAEVRRCRASYGEEPYHSV